MATTQTQTSTKTQVPVLISASLILVSSAISLFISWGMMAVATIPSIQGHYTVSILSKKTFITPKPQPSPSLKNIPVRFGVSIDLEKEQKKQEEKEKMVDHIGYVFVLAEKPVLGEKMRLQKDKMDRKTIDARLKIHEGKIQQQQAAFLDQAKKILGKTNIKSKISVNKNDLLVLNQTQITSNMVALHISDQEARAIQKSVDLGQLPEIKSMAPNYLYELMLDDSVKQINADDVWAEKTQRGENITGKGIKIGIIDTGVDYTHDDLGGCLKPEEQKRIFPDGTCFTEKAIEFQGEEKTDQGIVQHTCKETDGGMNYCHIGSELSMDLYDSGFHQGGFSWDRCINDHTLQETYCKDNGTVASVDIVCPFGCYGNAYLWAGTGGRCISLVDINTAGCSKVKGGHNFVTCNIFNKDGSCFMLQNENNNPLDDLGHGTHVAAIAAGNGTLKGVAYEADIYAYKIFNEQGYTMTSWIVDAVDRSVRDGMDVINLSLGGPIRPGDELLNAVDNASDNGVIAVVSAGNSGPGGNLACWPAGRGSSKSICSPGISDKVITVGAVDKNDIVADFSSRGPANIGDFRIKPDISAPGVDICAAQFDNAFASIHGEPSCLDDKHIEISGTSMAAPHIAGAVALLKQATPAITQEEIKSIFILGSKDTKVINYLGLPLYRGMMPSSFVNTTELCTQIKIPINIGRTDVYAMYFDPALTEKSKQAILRNDNNGLPGEILQQSAWAAVTDNTQKVSTSFSSIPKGKYWLCGSFKESISLKTDIMPPAFLPISFFNSNSQKFELSQEFITGFSLYLQYQTESTVYDDGGGRVNIAKALHTPIVLSKNNLSFGVVKGLINESFSIKNRLPQNITFTIRNSPARYMLDLQSNLAEQPADFLSIGINGATLSPGGEMNIPIQISIPENAQQGYYNGKIIITVNHENYVLPYSYIVVHEKVLDAPMGYLTPKIDGWINSNEWLDAKVLKGIDTQGKLDLYMKSAKVNGEDTLFIAAKINQNIDPRCMVERRIMLSFDEGDDQRAGSGSFDRVLTHNQDDRKILYMESGQFPPSPLCNINFGYSEKCPEPACTPDNNNACWVCDLNNREQCYWSSDKNKTIPTIPGIGTSYTDGFFTHLFGGTWVDEGLMCDPLFGCDPAGPFVDGKAYGRVSNDNSGVEFEFAIPFRGTDRFPMEYYSDYSDININYGDDLGFALSALLSNSNGGDSLDNIISCNTPLIETSISNSSIIDRYDAMNWVYKIHLSNIPPPKLFRRGDANADGRVDISDAVYTLNVLFVDSSLKIVCDDAADSNDDGRVDIGDAINTLNYLFSGTGDITPPGPLTPGPDPTDDGLGCARYPTEL